MWKIRSVTPVSDRKWYDLYVETCNEALFILVWKIIVIESVWIIADRFVASLMNDGVWNIFFSFMDLS